MKRSRYRVCLVSLYAVENRGVRYLSAVLKAAGFQVDLVFFKRWVNNNLREASAREIARLLDLIGQLRSDLVGISFGTPYLKIARSLSGSIRSRFALPVVAGGVHPTISPEDCLGDFDYVCVGEGEYPLRELAAALAEGRPTGNIPNIWPSGVGAPARPGLRPLITDLDTLPFPDYEDGNKHLVDGAAVIGGELLKNDAEYRIYPSRGCPFNCAYCNSAAIREIYRGLGPYYRYRSPENVVAELKYALDIFPRTRRIKFDGDTFTFPREWIEKFAALYREEIGLPFEILLHPASTDEEVLARLKRAGLVKVQMGIESGSEEESRSVYLRESKNESVVQFANCARRLKIQAVYDVICDNPLATDGDRRACLDFLLSLPRPFKLYLYSLTVFPKTALARDFLRRGLIGESEIEGAATKSFRQFRAGYFYPRPPGEKCWLSLWALTSKSFIPRCLIRFLARRAFLKKHPLPVQVLAFAADFVRMAGIAAGMSLRGELTWLKLKQYGRLKSWITQ